MSSIYTLIPRPIYDFAHLDALTRYTFGLIYDRWTLSYRKENRARFTDDKGIFCYYERKALAAEMGISLPTLRRCINALEDAHLIIYRRYGLGAPWRYYITERARDHMECASESWWYGSDDGGHDPVKG